MKAITDKQAQDSLPQLREEAAASHEPIQINGGTAGAVLASEEDWRFTEETLYLLSVPGMREPIREGMQTPLEQCSSELSW